MGQITWMIDVACWVGKLSMNEIESQSQINRCQNWGGLGGLQNWCRGRAANEWRKVVGFKTGADRHLHATQQKQGWPKQVQNWPEAS